MLDVGLFINQSVSAPATQKDKLKNVYAPGALEVSKRKNSDRSAASRARVAAVMVRFSVGVEFTSDELATVLADHFRDDEGNPVPHTKDMTYKFANAMIRVGAGVRVRSETVIKNGRGYHTSIYKRVDDATPTND